MRLLIGNDQIISVLGVRDEISGSYINNATVTVTISDRRGDAVGGQSWPFVLDYIAASNGNYRGTLEDGLTLREDRYLVEVTASGENDLIAYWHQWITAEYRKLDD